MDFLTVLQPLGLRAATKKFWVENGELKRQDFDTKGVRLFMAEERPVSDIEELHAELMRLDREVDRFVVRGAPTDDQAGKLHLPHVRRCRASRKDSHKPTYREEPRRWIMLDIDGFPYDESIWDPYEDPNSFFEMLASKLCPDLDDVSFVYQFSASAGIGEQRPVAKVHLWFWLDRKYSSDEISRWAKRINAAHGAKLLDTVIYQPVGIHYTACPVIENGVQCRVRRRVGLVELGSGQAELDIPAGRQGELAADSGFRAGPLNMRSIGLDGWLARIGDHETGEGFYYPTFAAIGCYFGVEGSDADPGIIRKKVTETLRKANTCRHDPGYVEDFVSSKLDDMIEHARHAQKAREDETGYKPNGARMRLQGDISKPFYPYPEFSDREEGIKVQTDTINEFLDQAVRRAAYRIVSEDPGSHVRRSDFGIDDTVANRLQITGPVGSGKTRAVENWLAKNAEQLFSSLPGTKGKALSVFFATGLIEKAQETSNAITELGSTALTVRGVAASDPESPKAGKDFEKMCWRSDLAVRVQSLNGELSHICKECPFRFKCGFRRQQSEVRKYNDRPGVKIFTGSHEYLHFPSGMKAFDIVIADERYKAERVTTHTISPLLLGVEAPLSYMPKELDRNRTELIDDNGRVKVNVHPDVINSTLFALYHVIQKHPDAILDGVREFVPDGFSENLTKSHLKDVRRALLRVYDVQKPFSEEGAKFNTLANDQTIKDLLSSSVERSVRIGLTVIDGMLREYDKPRSQANGMRVLPSRGRNGSLKIQVYDYKVPSKVPSHASVLLLDATGKLELNRKIWGENLRESRVSIESQVSATQVINPHNWTVSSIVGNEKSRDRSIKEAAVRKRELVASVINSYATDRNKVFVAAPMSVEKALKPLLNDNVLTAHYNALRGVNAFESCETGFLVCDAMVQPKETLKLALCYGVDDDQVYELEPYLDQERRLRMRDPKEVQTVINSGLASPKMETFRQILVDDEVLQAIGRIRGFWNRRELFIFSNRVYDQTIDRVELWSEFTANGAVKRAAKFDLINNSLVRFGYLVNSPSWLTRAFPDEIRHRSLGRSMLASCKNALLRFEDFRVEHTRNGAKFTVFRLDNKKSVYQIVKELGEGFKLSDESSKKSETDPLEAIILDGISRGYILLSVGWLTENGYALCARSARKIIDQLRNFAPDAWKQYKVSTIIQKRPSFALSLMNRDGVEWSLERDLGKLRMVVPVSREVNESTDKAEAYQRGQAIRFFSGIDQIENRRRWDEVASALDEDLYRRPDGSLPENWRDIAQQRAKEEAERQRQNDERELKIDLISSAIEAEELERGFESAFHFDGL